MSTINEEGKWTVLESKYLIRRPWLTARVDKVQLPDGRINDEYYVLEYPDWVNVIAITDDGRFVMERQYRHAMGITEYELPCGVIESGEEPLDAAKRELEEETGYTGGEWQKWMTIGSNPGSNNNTTHCYIARGVKKTSTPHLDATEDLSAYLLTKDEVFDILRTDDIRQALMAAPLWKYFFSEEM